MARIDLSHLDEGMTFITGMGLGLGAGSAFCFHVRQIQVTWCQYDCCLPESQLKRYSLSLIRCNDLVLTT